ncbi:hypothetical protein [Cupriavidus nantongensis]|uniref:Uncharacterized protein n=1 Tax=Cupriavidus nantongensis TaxID=1796606 RepID=A0A142JS80_9BURK|nr:hypothetical protein [Cupriavidus nantongensis]AMR80942.1 hypothetical protein A2G96_24300 [Cupriavidus nantongensis]
MDFGMADHERLLALYNGLVFFYLVPRYLLFPSLYGERYLRTAILLSAVLAANYLALWQYHEYYGGNAVPTLYLACFGPAMSVWMALLNCKIEKDNPGYYRPARHRK